MKFLVDANLSPRLASLLAAAGFDAVHVADAGMATASDEAIFDYAVDAGLVIVTAGSDFPMLLALRRASSTSVVLLRHSSELSPDDHAALVGCEPSERGVESRQGCDRLGVSETGACAGPSDTTERAELTHS